jgi:hypothetical protein
VCLALATIALAQTPTQPAGTPPAGQARPRGPRPAPTNLKVLPKDTTGDQINVIMHGFEAALGVECEYCHARNPETKRNDFASDANPVKDKARVMIKVADTINTQFLSQLNNPKPENPVTCGTCHRGVAHPTVFVPKEEERAPRPATLPATPKQ